MNAFENYKIPYEVNPEFGKRAAYFCMEFGIDQALKIYSGGLGYLAGSHMRSAYELKQNLVGIGILWKNGYYDQVRQQDQTMGVLFQEKIYNFLVDTNIVFEIIVNNHPVSVKAMYLSPTVFGTAPMFFLTTDIPENDYLARTISHRLYDNNAEAKVAQNMLLGIGGAKLLDILNYNTEIYHLNEAHALPAAFYLYKKLGSVEAVQEKLVFTTHTPVEAGNEKHDIHLLDKMSFFGNISLEEVRKITNTYDNVFNHTLVALRMAKIANAVSQMHADVANEMWEGFEGICQIIGITNSQNHKYWADPELEKALAAKDDNWIQGRKKELKADLFRIVADQTGSIFDPEVLTIVWARRFARYKRADLITKDMARFERIIASTDKPIQIIWSGKPYPMDYGAIEVFNYLVELSKKHGNLAVLTGYELALSKALKQGSDIWLNTPRITREASGTSGMTAAMNASVNFSTFDGWIPEFARHGENAYIVPSVDITKPVEEQDVHDMNYLLDILEHEIIPTYYDNPSEWWTIVKQSMMDVTPFFDADRMATEYYERLYTVEVLAEAI